MTLTRSSVAYSVVTPAARSSHPKRLDRGRLAVDRPCSPEDRYEVVRRLGAGSMGTVFLGRDTLLNRPVAIKIPRLPKRRDRAAFINQFFREAQAAAQLHHRNICPVYDAGRIGTRPYMVMGFVNGPSLSAIIKQRPLPLPRVAAFLTRQLAAALAEAHRHGIVHRDVKPGNVIVDEMGEPVIVDFGTAKWMTDDANARQRTLVAGTLPYMAPEQIQSTGDESSPATDVYGLGVTLYQLLVGRLPFEGDASSVVCQITLEDPVPPSVFRSGIDIELEVLCLKMMSKAQQDRYPTMNHVVAALDGYLHKRQPPPVLFESACDSE